MGTRLITSSLVQLVHPPHSPIRERVTVGVEMYHSSPARVAALRTAWHGTARAPRVGDRAVEQRDAADEGRLEQCGSTIVGNKVIVDQGKVVRPSQLIASVGPTREWRGE
jgi:hypothetical protein